MEVYEKLGILSMFLAKPRVMVQDLLDNGDFCQLCQDLGLDIDKDFQTKIEDIENDYTYLFVGASKPLASPYASSYSKGGGLMGKPAQVIIRLLNKWGLEYNQDNQELADHIGLMANLLSILLEQRSKTDEDILKEELEKDIGLVLDQMDFMDQLIKKVRENEKHGFYFKVLKALEDNVNYLNKSRPSDLQG